MTKKFATTGEAADAAGVSRATARRACKENPGFAVRIGGAYRIPIEHLDRLRAGERPAQIAADAIAI